MKGIKNIYTRLLLPKLYDSFVNTFSSLDNVLNRFSKKETTIALESSIISLKIKIDNVGLSISDLRYERKFFICKRTEEWEITNYSFTDELFKPIRTFVFYNDGSNKSGLYNFNPPEILTQYLHDLLDEFTNIIQEVHYLPASRSGLYQALSAFGQIIAELSKSRGLLSRKIELPSIPESVSDYFIKLSNIKVVKRDFQDQLTNAIAEEIEKEMLKGTIEFDSQTKQLMFSPKETNLKLELSSTSSMVSELAPIVSYLRYVLTQASTGSKENKNKKHLIMIEEPEAHLHPEVQIQLTEIFSKLIGANVKLVITSHSNYIFNKVNNLILSKDLDLDVVNSCVFKQTPEGSILQPLEANELGVEDDNY